MNPDEYAAMDFVEGDAIVSAWVLKRKAGDPNAVAAIFVVLRDNGVRDTFVSMQGLRRRRGMREDEIEALIDDMRRSSAALPVPMEWEAVDFSGAADIPAQVERLRNAGFEIRLG